jgi:hypothetical protein
MMIMQCKLQSDTVRHHRDYKPSNAASLAKPLKYSAARGGGGFAAATVTVMVTDYSF